MKITKTQLKKLIKEELGRALGENNDPLNIPGVAVYGRQPRRGKAGQTVRRWAEEEAAKEEQPLTADQIEVQFLDQWADGVFGRLQSEEAAHAAFERFISHIARM